MSLVIEPTTGRRVLLFIGTIPAAGGLPGINRSDRPFDAGIAYVHSTGEKSASDPFGQTSMVNVSYADHNGIAGNRTSVRLLDRAQTTSDRHGDSDYAVWMPFQFEQAQRALQPKVQGGGATIELVKLEENGVLTDAGRDKLAAEPATGDAPQAAAEQPS